MKTGPRRSRRLTRILRVILVLVPVSNLMVALRSGEGLRRRTWQEMIRPSFSSAIDALKRLEVKK
jgi:hypothetical protein